jgi:glycosyltransferase involved in cell wall biosynthesis
MQASLTLAANAIPGLGGQGLNLQHMIEGLIGHFDLSLFCGEPSPLAATCVVPPSSLSTLIGRIPLVRRLRDWQTFCSDRHFDSYVAAHLKPVNIFQGATGQCNASLAKARELGCRTALDVVNTHIDDFAGHMERECARFGIRPTIHAWQKARIRSEYGRADLIRVMSRVAQRTFLARGFDPERVIVATPPMNCDHFPQAQFNGARFRISYVGLIEPWKGFHYLIEAFNSLSVPDAELVFWGGPGSRSVSRYLAVQMQANPAIRIRAVEVRKLGYGEVYAKSSVLVHPSLSDGFGYVVAEAMASGIPVIVTENTGAADLVSDGHNGFIVPLRDVESLRDRLSFLANNPAKLRQMGSAARETARRLTPAAFMRDYVAALQRLTA